MPEHPTFGRYTEIPFDRMTPEQQEGYRFWYDGPRGAYRAVQGLGAQSEAHARSRADSGSISRRGRRH